VATPCGSRAEEGRQCRPLQVHRWLWHVAVTHHGTQTLKPVRKERVYQSSGGGGHTFVSGKRFPSVLYSHHLCAAGKSRLEAQAVNLSCVRFNLGSVSRRKRGDVQRGLQRDCSSPARDHGHVYSSLINTSKMCFPCCHFLCRHILQT